MKHLALCTVALLPVLPVAAQETDDPLYWQVEALGWDLTDQFACPGVAVARISDGELAWALGAGYADMATEKLVTPETVFNIGSISKTIAAWGVMKLVEEGKLELDVPVEHYLTRWTIPPSEFDSKSVTLRRLLSHTAGLSLHGYPGYPPGEELPTIEESLSGASNAGELVLIMEPGTQWKYSGGGYTISQLIVEEVTGRDFAEYMKEVVIDPLGMGSSDYRWTETVTGLAATPYDQSGEPIGGPRFIALAAAGFKTSAVDLARFGIASMARGESKAARGVLSTETIASMQELQPASPNYGLGYMVEERADGLRVVGHGGSNEGWMARLALAPDHQDGIVILTNGSNGQSLHEPILAVWRAALLEAR